MKQRNRQGLTPWFQDHFIFQSGSEKAISLSAGRKHIYIQNLPTISGGSWTALSPGPLTRAQTENQVECDTEVWNTKGGLSLGE
jgi:hypothetical protein